MSELSGDQGTWRFGDDEVRIEYADKRKVHRLLRLLGACAVPFASVESVDFHTGSGRKKWRLEMRLVQGADPFAPSGASGDDPGAPFVLTGPADGVLLAEYYADELRAACSAARALGPAVDPVRVARSLVPGLPHRVSTMEGELSFDGEAARFAWTQIVAGVERWRQGGRTLPVERIIRAEWRDAGSSGYGGVRLVLTGETDLRAGEPRRKDLATLLSVSAREHARVRLMAAVINAHLAAGDDRQRAALEAPESGAAEIAAPVDADEIYRRIRELGRLHEEGLLTTEEFTAKKAELLERL